MPFSQRRRRNGALKTVRTQIFLPESSPSLGKKVRGEKVNTCVQHDDEEGLQVKQEVEIPKMCVCAVVLPTSLVAWREEREAPVPAPCTKRWWKAQSRNCSNKQCECLRRMRHHVNNRKNSQTEEEMS